MTKKVVVQCVSNKLALSENHEKLISLERKQNVTLVRKQLDSPYLGNFFPQAFLSEYLNWVFLYFGDITSLLATINILFSFYYKK